MMRALALSALMLAAVAAIPPPSRIVGGTITDVANWPMAVAVLFSRTGSGTFIQTCGGTILNNRAILSAAQCYVGELVANRWRMRVGSSRASTGGALHLTARFIMHPSYDARIGDNDIAILHTTVAISFNINTAAGAFAGANRNLPDNSVVWSIGWGATAFGGGRSEDLRQVQIWTINQAICIKRFAEIDRVITDNMLCAGWIDVGGRDHCHGDSGGPLIHNKVIVGVISWRQQCALPRYPGVYARVSRFASWIYLNS